MQLHLRLLEMVRRRQPVGVVQLTLPVVGDGRHRPVGDTEAQRLGECSRCRR